MRLERENVYKATSKLMDIAWYGDIGDTRYDIHFWGGHPEHRNNPIHKHSFFELCYVIEGTGEYMEEGVLFPLEAGTLFLSRPERVHQIRSEEGLFLIWVSFEMTHTNQASLLQVDMPMAQVNTYVYHHMQDSPVILIWKALYTSAIEGFDRQQNIIREMSKTLMLSIENLFLSQKNHDSHARKGIGLLDKRLEQVKRLVMDNYSMPLQLEDIARVLHVSERQIIRLFANDNLTFSRYLNRIRVEKACEYLRETDAEPLAVIAEKCGFQSVHYFSRVFTAWMGESPGRFRKRLPGQLITAFIEE